MKENFTIRRSQPGEIAQVYNNQGAAIVIFNRDGQVLLGTQNGADVAYSRRHGHLNIFTETREQGESIRETFWRAMSEELGQEKDDWERNFIVIPGTYREKTDAYIKINGYEYKYRLIALLFLGDHNQDPNELFCSCDGEISSYIWVETNELNPEMVEKGAIIAIKYFTDILLTPQGCQ